MKRDKADNVSFVVPMYNEEKCVAELYSRILNICKKTKIDFEIVCVNDYSQDSTLTLLKSLHKKDKRVKIVSFSRNFGHQVGVMAGLRYASGDCIVIMDADLQDPPELLPKMLEKRNQGFSVVYGIRKNRKENFIKKFCYNFFYRLLYRISSLYIPLDAGDFCLMDRRVAEELKKFSEDRPFVRGLRSWVGFKQTGIEYSRAARKAGESKYSFIKLLKLAFDGFFSFSNVMLKISGAVGLLISALCIIYGLFIGITRILAVFGLYDSEKIIPGWTTLVVSMMFFVGLQFVFLGMLGEYIGRIFLQVKNRPLYIVEEEIGFNKNKLNSKK